MFDKEYLLEIVSSLKKVNRRMLTNFYVSESKLEDYIEHKKVTYDLIYGKYIHIYVQDEEFLRLYFCIADIGCYQPPHRDMVYVCDMFEQKENSGLFKVMNILIKNGFKAYPAYRKWICKQPLVSGLIPQEWKVVEGWRNPEEVLKNLFQIFDKYTDLLPQADKLKRYQEEEGFIGIYDMEDSLIGGIVYTEKERTITEEFLFVKPQARGRKVSYYLYDSLYKKFSNNHQYIAWIREDNAPCIALHESYNYKKLAMKKITLVKQ